MKIHARVGKEELEFLSDRTKRFFFQEWAGKEIEIVLDDLPTAEMRRYFEGCIVPAVFYAHPHIGWHDFSEARDALKYEFLARSTKNLRGLEMRTVPSTSDLSKRQFITFLESIARWLTENELVAPDVLDADSYKQWRDSAPSTGELYPPLARLKLLYTRERERQEKRQPVGE